MVSLNGFDATEVDPEGEFEPLPKGSYLAVIGESGWKDNKKKNGRFLEMKLQVIDGPHANRTLFARLNLENPSATAVSIARSELSAICHAVGVLKPRDSEDLHDIPLVVDVGTREHEGKTFNEILKFRKREGGGEPVGAGASAGGDGVASERAPWER